MRKHRLYGVVIAVLLGVGLNPRPIFAHVITGTDSSRASSQFVSADYSVRQQYSDQRGAVTRPPSTLRPGTDKFILSESQTANGATLTALTSFVPPPPPPPPPPAAPPAPHRAPAVAATHVQVATAIARPATPGVWAQLRWCESRDNYADNTGNGYYGAYQFALSTWRSLGLSGLPSSAPAAIQDHAAQELEARSGWAQWPVCGRDLGVT